MSLAHLRAASTGRILRLLGAALPLLAFSCQYSLVKEHEASLPAGVNSLAIPLAKNFTIEAGLEDMFTQEMSKRLSADGRIAVVPADFGAEAELRCVMRDLSTQPVSFTKEGRAAAESITLEAECSLVAPDSESLIWKSGPLAASEEYPLTDNYLANEDGKARALAEICRDISESVRSRLLDSF